MNIVIYPVNIRSVHAGNCHTWASNNGCDLVLELHLNSATDPSAHGYETLKHTSATTTTAMQNVHNAMVGIGWRDRGIKTSSNLGNMNLMKNKGIPYALLEFCFIKNANDMAKWNANIGTIPAKIVNACKSAGVKKLGIIYGHGGNDVGALGLKGEKEAIEVRRLKFNTQTTTTPPAPKPTGESIGEVEVASTVVGLNVRAGTSTATEILGTVTAGFKTPTFRKIGEWYEIAYQNRGAYLHEDYVNFRTFKVSEEETSQENMNKLKAWEIALGEQSLDALNTYGIINNPEDWKTKLGDKIPNWLMFSVLGRIVEKYDK